MEKNYYDEIAEKVKDLIDKGEFQQAMEQINEELKAPYVPFDFEEELEKLSIQINESFAQNKDNSYLNWNFDKISDIMGQTLDQEMHIVAFDALRSLNARKIMPDIKNYLLNQNVKNEYKTFLLMVLIEQKVDEIIEIKKQELTIRLNPATFDLSEAKNFLTEIEEKLEDLVADQNPSLFTICKHIANTYYYNIFPDFRMEGYGNNEIVAAIIMFAHKSLGLDFDETLKEKLDFNYSKAMLLLNKFDKLI
ncbi:hypothetical protein SCHIN_v1c04770 [Spiroplasma chinense]|uniref:DUF3196 domain-containing protein n=1 Tax=Spiroplasma chinense TaxID=216932 RepID=A0A5B9Y3N1_9MOLU|nr:DUF3196 family protein [Spiroplasma chinense]QEH61674.1 hypothetical protein SCHIN_v1c04770 [Spiroplasma chinense]